MYMDTIMRRVEMIDAKTIKPWPSVFIYDIICKFEDEEDLTVDELYIACGHYLWLIENNQQSAIEFETLCRIFQ